MKTYDQQAASVLQEWTEKEFRATLGAPPRAIQEDNEYDPKGPHRWFAEAVADVSAIVALREMAKTWKIRPPYASWRSCAGDTPACRRYGLRRQVAARRDVRPVVQRERTTAPARPHRRTDQGRGCCVVAVVLEYPDCWDAMNWLDDDMTHETFSECLRDWHSRVPEQHRPFVRRIAAEFGIEIDDRAGR